MGSYDVFISYSRDNIEYVRRLFEEMMTHYISVWFDKNESHQNIGSAYVQAIHHCIDSSNCFLLIYTKEVENSAFVIKEELEYAISRGKRALIYPLEPIDMKVSHITHCISRMQWLDFGQRMTGYIYEDQSIFMIRILLQYKLGHLTVAGNYGKICGCSHGEYYNRNNFSLYVVNKSFFLPIPEKQKNELTNFGFLRKDFDKQTENHLKSISPDNVQIANKLFTFLNDHEDIYSLSVIYNRITNYLKKGKYGDVNLPRLDLFGFKDFVNIVANMVACNLVLELKEGKTIFNGAELGVYNINENRTTNSEKHCVEMQLFYSDYFTYKCMTEMYHILCSINDAPFKLHNIYDVNKLAPFFCSLGIGGFLVADTKEGSSLLWRRRYTRSFSFDEIWHFPFDAIVNLQLDGVKDSRGCLKVEKDNTVYIDTDKLFHRVLSEEIGAVPTNLEQNRCGIFEVGIVKSERLEIEIFSHATIKLKQNDTPMGAVKKMYDHIDDAYTGFQQFSKMQFLYFNEDVLLGKMLSPEAHAMFNRLMSYNQMQRSIDNKHPSIFISYKRVDKQKVMEIKSRIEDELGTKCWFDVDGIESDAQFAKVIINAINECEVFLFMYSHAHSEISELDNDWTIREINFAQKKKKRIVFVNIDGTQLTDWFEMMFGTKQQVDANSEQAMKKLLLDISNWMNM